MNMRTVTSGFFVVFLLGGVAAANSAARAEGQGDPYPQDATIPPHAPVAVLAAASPEEGASAAPYAPPPANLVLDLSDSGNPEQVADAVLEPVSSWEGPIGLFRVSTADVASAGRLRLGFHGEYARSNNLIVRGDENSRSRGALVLGYSPVPFVDLFATISGATNQNRRICATGPTGAKTCVSEPGRSDPEIIRSFGDLVVGSKFARPVARDFSVGAEVGLRFLSSVSGAAWDAGATSVWFGVLGSLDMQHTLRLPVRVHGNMGFYRDNSANLQDFSQVSRGSRAVSTFAYGMGRDRMRMALAADASLAPKPGILLQPILEYHWDFVTADPDSAYDDYRSPLCKGSSPLSPANGQPCRDNRDGHWLTFGVRARVLGGVSVDAGLDVGLRAPGFPYGPAVAPYNFIFGVGYPLDLGALGRPKVYIRTRTVEKASAEKKREPEGLIAGKVVSDRDGAPVPGAVVAIVGRRQARVATDPDGTFMTRPMPPGRVTVEVSAFDFDSVTVTADVTDGNATGLPVTLKAKIHHGKVSGKVLDQAGKGLATTVILTGTGGPVTLKTDAAGAFATDLLAGTYWVRTEDIRFLKRAQKFEIEPGASKTIEISNLRKPPAFPGVVLRSDHLALARPIVFQGKAKGKAQEPVPGVELAPASLGLLDEVVDFLLSHPEIRRLRIEAHVDNSVGDRADAITAQQAHAIGDYLVKQGIPEDRIEAVGMGAKKPLVPNIGQAAKVKNRRIELRI